ncbi:SAF domain-containing protein [Yinghuangia seranimata]|uniref:SAF domain-containing protein n=1 Tax=Yinghuangia seranimata TaxID=408067 RepID=UPI00248C92D5|nr:SAF domain-containing protein [Yinghuangia seranimata]MDI2127149.1 SAF domain-containing protein [Yinghuangia seranimata]
MVAVVCAAVFVLAARGADDRVVVLAVARPVQAGQVVGRADLSEVDLGGGRVPGVVPASQVAQVVGRVAVVPLVPGALLAPGQVGEAAGFPPIGRSLVAVLVKDGSAPSGLAAGQRVAVLSGPMQGVGRTDPPPVGSGTSGLVVEVRAAEQGSGGAVVVTLLVDASQGPGVAVLADPRLIVLAPQPEGVPR